MVSADAAKTMPAALTAAATVGVDEGRLCAVVRQHYQFLWRSLRRLGVDPAEVDDAAQQALSVLARRLPDIEVGAEKAFLFQTALRVASDARRARARSPLRSGEGALANAVDPAPSAEEQIAKHEARALLDEVLDAMEPDLRAVFVLFELEEMTTAQIAALVGIPAGTVSSRLYRARKEFEAMSARVQARHGSGRRRP